MNQQGADVSNYTAPFNQEQLDFARDNWQFVIIGLQSDGKAALLKEQLKSTGVVFEYYVDRPGRSLAAVDPGARVWVDIEVGCFTTIADVNAELDRLYLQSLVPGIYCNRTSLGVLDGDPGTQWAHLPLWVADYRTPDLATFRPFNGWTKPTIWQYSSNGVAGINCDLNISFEEAPVVPVTPPADPTPQEVQAALTALSYFIFRGWDLGTLSTEDRRAIKFAASLVPEAT